MDKNDPTYYQNVINGARDENGNLIYITDEDGYWVDPYTYFNKKLLNLFRIYLIQEALFVYLEEKIIVSIMTVLHLIITLYQGMVLRPLICI